MGGILRSGVLLLLISTFMLTGCGRDPSRFLGKDSRQVIEVPHMKEFVDISYDHDGTSTKKNVTFLATDGYYYTREYKDVSPLQGIIRWVPHTEDESFWQSRSISRWTGKPVNLKLPEDFDYMEGVSVTSVSKSERTKMMTYRSTDGRILSKEYREGVIDRHLEGWVEVRAKKE